MSIAYYVSGHGYGHFVRAAAVLRALPPDIPILLRTEVARDFVARELAGVDFQSDRASFDVGVVGPDSTRVDAGATFERAVEIQSANEARLGAEIDFLERDGVRLVVSDVPSFPLRVAARAGIPSVLVANFTWVEIYADLVRRLRDSGDSAMAGRGEALIEELRAEYALGDLLLVPQLALEMEACRRAREIPIIARRGVDRRAELCERLGLDAARPIFLIYLGREGYEGLELEKIAALDGAQFFSFQPLGDSSLPVHVLAEGLIDHVDATATADAVVGKLGYSLCAECLATRTPLLYPPRPEFIEAHALARGMSRHGLGVALSARDFASLDWSEGLATAKTLAEGARPVATDGGGVAAEIVASLWRGESVDAVLGGLSSPADRDAPARPDL